MKSDFSKESIIKKKDEQGKSPPRIWVPETDFTTSDFPVSEERSTKRVSPGKAGPVLKSSSVSSPPQVKVNGWKPPVLSVSPDSVQKQNSVQEKNSSQNIVHKTEPVISGHKVHSQMPQNQSSSQTKISSSRDATLEYFQEMIMNFPENTVYLLRNWYFKKYSPGGAGIESIHPHDRIFIVLASAGQEITAKLFGIMSPMERQNFSEILAGKKYFNGYQIQTVRKKFMNSVRDFV
jgi:hypothetical protein